MSNKPNFFLVGASKAGTTAVAEALGAHPDIFMSIPKEPNFFNLFDEYETIPSKEIQKYLKIFESASSESVIGEASVSYLSSIKAAKHIYEFAPDAKILLSLRNPLERVKSLFEMYQRLGLKDSFEDVIISDPWLVRQCFYFDVVKSYIDAFPNEQIYWFDFNELKSDWNGIMNHIHRFLGVTLQTASNPVVRNVGGVPKNPIFNIMLNRNIINFCKAILPKQLHNFTDSKIKALAFKSHVITEGEYNYLIKAFTADISSLDQLLKSNFKSRWFKENVKVNTSVNP